jgi:hypothetical protein
LPQTGVFNPFAPAENQEQFDGSRASFYRDCPYIGERFGENSVGGKWLMDAGLRIPLTLSGRGRGAVGG